MHKVIVGGIVVVVLGAIGIMVASSLGQTPEQISLVSDRVLDRVTRGIVPEDTRPPVVELTPQEKLIAAADTHKTSIATIHTIVGLTPSLRELEDKFIARGVVLSDDGYIATAAGALTDGVEYSVQLSGIPDPVVVESVTISGDIAILKVDARPKHWVSEDDLTALSDAADASEYQVVALGGDVVTNLFIGSVTSAPTAIGAIETDIASRLAYGTILVENTGNIVGLLRVQNGVNQKAAFVPISAVVTAFGAARK